MANKKATRTTSRAKASQKTKACSNVKNCK